MEIDKRSDKIYEEFCLTAMNERGVCDELYGQNDAI
jgi:hypothetical protein